ncbi:MAG: phosphate ABC transporter substrate-binding protein PstS [Propionivibrio sp.]|uniref:phosphate ABC transporter substrate-binding protein PstS n=1 Tax=Propionivibrio sp. TaxID=2212460 RepID=UPI001A3ABAA9|nr:phosphate ABC transporter substrate-binding protein PstS [Propionivibrio sp.]MBL8415239.1 phosphate ABC transporter substrate-binding protein PstS [Propionivibrio sp.]
MKLRIAILGSILAAAALSAPVSQAQTAKAGDGATLTLRGAGATFPAPLYKKWIAAYRKVEPTTLVEYAPVGSGDGVKRFLADSVDFGASDAAMTDDQIASAKQGTVLVPATAGLIVLAYNLPGLNGPLKLSRDTYVALLMGKIPRWNDARIQATNPGLNLPDREIVVVARQDSSGTTFALTNHLSAVSPQWRDRGPGVGKVVAWPDNAMIVRGNEGVASRIKLSVGSVGYIEYSFARYLGLPTAHLENKEGRFVAPSDVVGETTLAANLNRIPANLRVFIPDPDGAESYPIISFSWLLLKERNADPAKAAALKRFVNWGLSEGQGLSSELGYIRLPANVAELGKAALTRVQ